MKAIVIAAGRGVRMGPHTRERPKCMVEIRGRSLLSYSIESLRNAGCESITVVTGHLADRIVAPGCRRVHNDLYSTNNILHSLMYARADLDDDVLVSYSDIYVEPSIYERLAGSAGDIVLVIDLDWNDYYEGRSGHPVEEAEKAIVEITQNGNGVVREIGKRIDTANAGSHAVGEFLGLWKMSSSGAAAMRKHFETIDAIVTPDAPFQEAGRWRSAYVTDMFTHMLQAGCTLNCILVERGWAEFDLAEDIERLEQTIVKQRLYSLPSNTESV